MAYSDDIAAKGTHELANGNYTIVSIEIDATGNRINDEIIQLTACMNNASFSEYIMPYIDLTPSVSQHHQIYVFHRMNLRFLKCTRTDKHLNTKSEYSTMKNFLEWLEANLESKNSKSDGIIMIYFSQYTPMMILRAMDKYSLLHDFCEVVKSFVDIRQLIETKVNNCTLRELGCMIAEEANENQSIKSAADKQIKKDVNENKRKVMLSDKGFNAKQRAQFVYKLARKLSNSKCETMQELLCRHANANTRDVELMKLELQKAECQYTLRPIFSTYFDSSFENQKRAHKFRAYLADLGLNKQRLFDVWSEKSLNGLKAALKDVPEITAEEKDELVLLLDSFFDPKKDLIRPERKTSTECESNAKSSQECNLHEWKVKTSKRCRQRPSQNVERTSQLSREDNELKFVSSENITSKSVQTDS